MDKQIILDFDSYRAGVSIDRRSEIDQKTNKMLVLALMQQDGSGKLAKLPFNGDKCNEDQVVYSPDFVKERLQKIQTLK